MAIATPDSLFDPTPVFGAWGRGARALVDTVALPAEGALDVDKLLVALERGGAKGVTAQGAEALDYLQIQLLDIGLSISAPITHLTYDQSAATVDVVAMIDQSARISVTLGGEVVAEGTEFSPREISLRITPTDHFAQAEFVASTLTAALALGGAAAVRLMGEDVRFRGFDIPVARISDLLRSRETSLRLMVIGAAMRVEFEFPPQLSGAEIQAIDFVRHAILDRTFTWPTPRHPLILPANELNLRRFQSASKPARIVIPWPTTVEILGHEIPLGTTRVIMEGAVIEDLDQVVNEVSRLDGHVVQAYVRSLEGRATIECPEAPTLPEHPWTENETALMSLEEQLCSRLTERYNALAAGTLQGLSEEEKNELTNPVPSIGELFLRDGPANEG
jgi:hypothetical protein